MSALVLKRLGVNYTLHAYDGRFGSYNVATKEYDELMREIYEGTDYDAEMSDWVENKDRKENFLLPTLTWEPMTFAVVYTRLQRDSSNVLAILRKPLAPFGVLVWKAHAAIFLFGIVTLSFTRYLADDRKRNARVSLCCLRSVWEYIGTVLGQNQIRSRVGRGCDEFDEKR